MTEERLRRLLRAPAVAWPTVAVSALTLLAFLLSLRAALLGTWPLWVSTVVSAFAAYFAFTPAHDAAHGSVSRLRWLNEATGRVSALVLGAPFVAFRHMHLEHHRFTNDPSRDPDRYSGKGPTWLLPWRWMTQDLHYYGIIARCWRERPRGEIVELVAVVSAYIAVIGGLIAAGYGTAVLFAWILPVRIAVTGLAFSFDYLPHVPHEIPAKDDRFRATHILIAPGLTPLFLYQNYHLIHHLYPGVPFYRYRRIFDQKREELVENGASIKHWSLAS